MNKRFFIKVFGKVQGVGFRYYTQQKAQQLGLKGWVRNEMDGSVEIEAEGDEMSLAELISFIKKGASPRGRVDKIQVVEKEPKESERKFTILY
jgi:acylphosphatase